MKPATGHGGRVGRSHEIARSAFIGALMFAVGAAIWSIIVLVDGGSWWGPLHAFLAGTVLLAISGASQMFTITWSSTSPPAVSVTTTQRWSIIVGAILVLVGITQGMRVTVWVGAVSIIVGLGILGWSIYGAIRRSLLRRFDLSARFYLLAFSSGILGVGLGAWMGAGHAGSSIATVRLVHSHLNLVGLVGLTILGTIPTLLPTTAYSKAVSGREAIVAWWMSVAGAAAMATGLLEPRLVGVGAVLIGSAGLVLMAGMVPKLWASGRSHLTFLQITIGMAWLAGWSTVHGGAVVATSTMPSFGSSTAAVVIGGVGQILAGSLAYLIPVLKGSPFVENRRIMEGRGWLPIGLVNLGVVALVAGITPVGVALLGGWLVDFAVRLSGLRHRAPDSEESGA